MARSTTRSGTRRASAVWATIGVVALGLGVLVLAFLALTDNRNVESAGETPGATTPAPAPTPTPTEAPAVIAPVAAPTRVLAALDGQNAVRAAVTACPQPTTVEFTADGGATWQAAAAPTVAAVQRLEIGTDAFVAAIGLDATSCAPSYERSFTDGAAWQAAPAELATKWSLDPVNPAVVIVPDRGAVPAPCPAVVDLAPADADSAAVLCADASVVATDDGGSTWSQGVTVAGARDLAATEAGYIAVLSGGAGCAGAQALDLFDGGAGLVAGTVGACLGESAGAVAISAAGAEVWVWVDDVVGLSADQGESWQ